MNNYANYWQKKLFKDQRAFSIHKPIPIASFQSNTKIRGLFPTNTDSIIIKSIEQLADLQNRKTIPFQQQTYLKRKWVTTEEYLSWAEWGREAPPWIGGDRSWQNGEMGDVGVVARWRRWEIGHDGGDFRLCTRRRVQCCSLVSGDGPDEARKKF